MIFFSHSSRIRILQLTFAHTAAGKLLPFQSFFPQVLSMKKGLFTGFEIFHPVKNTVKV